MMTVVGVTAVLAVSQTRTPPASPSAASAGRSAFVVRAVDHQDGPVEADLWVFEWKDSAAKRAVADGGFTNETSSKRRLVAQGTTDATGLWRAPVDLAADVEVEVVRRGSDAPPFLMARDGQAELVVPFPGPLGITILDHRGRLVERSIVQVRCVAKCKAPLRDLPADDGHLVVDVMSGQYEVRVFTEGLFAPPVIVSAPANVTVTLPAPSRYRGRVVDERGAPVTTFTINAKRYDAVDGRFSLVTDEWLTFADATGAVGHLQLRADLGSDVGDIVLRRGQRPPREVVDSIFNGTRMEEIDAALSLCTSKYPLSYDCPFAGAEFFLPRRPVEARAAVRRFLSLAPASDSRRAHAESMLFIADRKIRRLEDPWYRPDGFD